jgi:hypothetical protein
MRASVYLLAGLLATHALWVSVALASVDKPAASQATRQQRCGWFDNPSPQNASLIDRDGNWTVSVQGGESARGSWPRFSGKQWVKTGAGSYGYGCTCMTVEVDVQTQHIQRIHSANAKPISACSSDKSIKDKEPFNPLR